MAYSIESLETFLFPSLLQAIDGSIENLTLCRLQSDLDGIKRIFYKLSIHPRQLYAAIQKISVKVNVACNNTWQICSMAHLPIQKPNRIILPESHAKHIYRKTKGKVSIIVHWKIRESNNGIDLEMVPKSTLMCCKI